MRYLTLNEALVLHKQLVTETGDSPGLRDLGALESSLAQPRIISQTLADADAGGVAGRDEGGQDGDAEDGNG